MAQELYNNIGTIGYPYGQLEKSKTFISAYEKVFAGDNIKSSVTQSDYDGLISSLEAINNIEDWELVKPITGHSYKIASYSYLFGDKIYYYFKSVNGGEETDKKMKVKHLIGN